MRLVGWQSVTVEPGALGHGRVSPEARMWRRWDEASERLAAAVRPAGELLVARGLGDIRTSVDLP